MFQQIMMIGNLGNDPEMRYTASGVPVTGFNMAVSRRWTGQDGQRQEKTTWFKVTVWRKQAETVSQYLTKGSKVLVIGEIEQPDIWTDRDGNPRVSLEVTAQSVKFLSSRGEATGESSYGGDQASSASGGGQASPASGGGDTVSDEDIPF